VKVVYHKPKDNLLSTNFTRTHTERNSVDTKEQFEEQHLMYLFSNVNGDDGEVYLEALR
jgi:hypothetical protein